MRTDAQRIARYEARMLSSLIDPTLAAVNAKAAVNFATYATDFYPNQVALRALLNAAGILPIKFGAYEAFHGQLYKLSRTCAGPSLAAAAAILIDKWSDASHLGAGAIALLTQVANDIYHVSGLSTP